MKRRSVLAMLLLAAGTSGSALAAEWDVGRLMQGLAQQRGGKVSFAEKKYLAILDRPVESTGELVYLPPARLEKRTLTPKVESLVLDRDLLVIERGKQRHTLQLQQYPEITAIVDSIRDTLAGDLKALERQYRVVLEGSQERWMLTLLPSDTRIAAIVLRIQISGVRNELRQIEMLQADGDRSVMILHTPVPR
jgi:hypothetical protein